MAASKAASGTGATKKTAKKATTKRAAKAPKESSKKIVLKDDTLYILSLRGKWFMWEPAAVYETYDEAKRARDLHEEHSAMAMSAAKITKTKLVR